MSDSNKSIGASYGRKRAKTACSTCRGLKRKCSGVYPCSMCVQYEYECKFEGKPRHAVKSPPSEEETVRSRPSWSSHTPSLITSPTAEQQDKQLELIKANAGLNFPQELFTRLDNRAPNVGPYAWNLGLGFHGIQPQTQNTRSLQDLMDRKDVNRFVNRYFESFHVIYGFLNEQELRLRLASRIRGPKARADVFDAVLCGAIALGMTFSGPSSLQQELNLVAHAHTLLSADTMFPSPSIEDVEAWLLRAFYMRIAGSHHAAWIASCTALQVAEAVALHLEPDDEDDAQADHKRKLFWMSRILNTWISLDTGRSPFEVRGATCHPPSPAPADKSAGYRNFVDLVTLYEISTYLDPQIDESPDLEDILSKIVSIKPRHDELVLSQANLVLCVFRRLRLARSSLSPELIGRMLDFLKSALDSAFKLIEAKQPWWHVVSVPLQFICILITLDTPQSLSHIGQGIRTLQQAAAQFDTPVTQGVVNIVGHLVRLSYEKKQEESAHLFGTFNSQSPRPHQRNIAIMPEKDSTPAPYDYQQDINPIGGFASVPPSFEGDLTWCDFLESSLQEFGPFPPESVNVSRP